MTPRLPVQPDNWQWRTEAIPGGAAVLVDIDGVLSDAAGRQHYLEAPRRDLERLLRGLRR